MVLRRGNTEMDSGISVWPPPQIQIMFCQLIHFWSSFSFKLQFYYHLGLVTRASMQCITQHSCGKNHQNYKSQNNCVAEWQYLCNHSNIRQYSLGIFHQTSCHSKKGWHTCPFSETDTMRNFCKVSQAPRSWRKKISLLLYLAYHSASMSSNTAQITSHSSAHHKCTLQCFYTQ